MAQCKYNMREHQISYDDGFSWTSLEVIRGDLVEYESPDCPDSGTEITKWVDLENDFLCEDDKKYKKQILYTSSDGGVTWYIYFPTTYRKGEYVGVDEAFCNNKFEGNYGQEETITTYTGTSSTTSINSYRYKDPLKVVKCNDNPTLTSGETEYYITGCTTTREIINRINNVVTYRSTTQCYRMASAKIGGCVTSIGDKAFSGETLLSSVTISDSVTSIGNYAFTSCSGLTSVDIPSGVTSIGQYAFSNCANISAMTLPSNLETIGAYAFRGCRSFPSTIDIPSGVTYIGTDAFVSTNITTMNMHSDIPPTLSGSLDSNIATIHVPCDSVNAYREASGWSSYANYIVKYDYCPYLGVKYFAVRLDGTSYTLECNESNVLSSGETYTAYPSSSVTIGSCVEEIGAQAFNWGSLLVRVNSNVDFVFNIPSGVIVIGDAAFEYEHMQTLTLPDTLISIGNGAFSRCSGLTSIDIPNSVTSIGTSAFERCSGATSLSLGSGISTIGNSAFSACTSLTSIDIPNNVTSIGDYAFRNCSGATSLTIGSGVTYIGNYAFNSCNHLKKITIEAVTPPTLSGTSAFTSTNNCPIYVSCDSVEAYKSANGWSRYARRILPMSSCPYEFKVSMYYANGENIKVPCGSSTTVTYSDTSAYYSKTSITNAEVGSCVLAINNGAYSGCTRLSSITIPNNVGLIGDNTFSGDTSLTSLTIPNSVGTVGSGVCQDCTSLQSVTLPYMAKIGEKSFFRCSSLASINIPNTVTIIGASAYTYCSGATSLSIGSGVTYIGDYAFNNCSSINSLTIPNSAVSIGNYAFAGCHSISSITIPDSVLSIGTNAFAGCRGATSLTIGSRVTSIAYAFGNCTSLTSVTIPNNVNDITSAFYQCSGLTSVIIGNGVTSIGYNTFYECSSLTSVTIPDSVTIIDGSAFENCSSLTSIEIPDSVTSIDNYAFFNCSGLTSVIIGNGVTSIGNYAFENCSSLTSITINATTPPTLKNYYVFDNTNNCPIYVPCDSVELYKSAYGWSKHASRIVRKQDCPTPPYAGDKFSASYLNGSAYTIECDSTSGITSATTRPNGYTYTAMTSAVVGDCVTEIGDRTFSGATSLSSVTIGSGVTSIGNDSFKNCRNLQSITIPNSVTSIGNNAFSGDTNLSSLSIGNGVASIGYDAFENCSSLISVTIPNSVTSIGYDAFRGCSGLDNIIVLAITPPTLGTSAFTDTNNCNIYVHCDRVDAYKAATNWSRYASRILAFDDCTNVQYRWADDGYVCDGTDKYENKKYQISYDNGVTWYDYGETMKGDLIESSSLACTKVRWEKSDTTQSAKTCDSSSLSRSDINNGTLTGITKIEIGDCVTSIGNGAFSGATSLSSITIPSSIASIGYNAFYRCSGLTSITVDCETPPTLNGGYPFDGTNNCPIYVPCSSYCAYKSASRWHYYANRIRKKDNSCTYLGDKLVITYPNSDVYTIECCGTELSSGETNAHTAMTSAVIGDCVTSIGDSAFQDCRNLSSVTISNSVTSIGNYVFSGCTSLSSLTIPSGVTEIGGSSLALSVTSMTINAITPPTINGGHYLGSNYPIYVPCEAYLAYMSDNVSTNSWWSYRDRIYKQEGCPITTPIFHAEYVNGSAYTLDYYGSSTLTTADTRPNGYTYTAMTSAEISNVITTINGNTFSGAKSLSSVTLPNTIGVIENCLFCNCTSLSSITIPNSVTIIGSYAFENCSGLTSITIPSGVGRINVGAFKGCSGLTSITILAIAPVNLGNNIDGEFDGTNNCPIYVPSNSVDAYKSNSSWSRYVDRIFPIP